MLTIDPSRSIPPSEQLRAQLVESISSGERAPGSKLPPVRRLAAELGLAPNTVAKTYRELESTGFVQTNGRNGTIVAPLGDGPEQHARAVALTRDFVAAMRALGADEQRALDYVRQGWLV